LAYSHPGMDQDRGLLSAATREVSSGEPLDASA